MATICAFKIRLTAKLSFRFDPELSKYLRVEVSR